MAQFWPDAAANAFANLRIERWLECWCKPVSVRIEQAVTFGEQTFVRIESALVESEPAYIRP